MRLLSISLLAIVGISAVSAPAQEGFEGKRIVRVLEEPRHRVVYHDGDLYLMDVQIRSGDTTLPHTHDSAILYTFVHRPDGPADGATMSNTDYAEQAFTHEVSNEGPGMLHILALSNYRQGGPARHGGGSGLGSPQLENPWFRSYRLGLAPGEETPSISVANPVVVVQVTKGTAHVTRQDGLVEAIVDAGSWVWREANSPFSVRNVGTQPIEFVVNEGRR